MTYQTIEVRPIAGALGAEIVGVDLKKPLDNQTWSEIHRAFHEHLAIYFRGQDLGAEHMMAFGRRFGEPAYYPFVKGIDGFPHIFEILKEPAMTKNFGGHWHSDSTYMEKPPLGTMLYAHETPSHGGDTLVANQYLAYESLSDGMKAMLGKLTGIYSASMKRAGGRGGTGDNPQMRIQNTEQAEAIESAHPVVRTHPETAKKALYVSSLHTARFEAMTEAESQPIVDYLQAQAVRPEFTARIKWEPGTLGIWDNRCVQHFAINDYHGQTRRMWRLTLGPEAPVA